MKLAEYERAPAIPRQREALMAPVIADTDIYSTGTRGAGTGRLPKPRSNAHARIAAVLREQRETLLPRWVAALRAACSLYTHVPDEQFSTALGRIFDGYRLYYFEDDPTEFLEAVETSARLRFSQGFPLVSIEESVGTVRHVVLPVILAEFAGEADQLVDAVSAMMTIEEMAFVRIAEVYQRHATDELRDAQEHALQAEQDKVVFCRRMARLATREKLVLCDPEEIAPREGAVCLPISEPRDIRAARQSATAAARAAGWTAERIYSLQLCVGEAGTNALRHGGGAAFQVWSEAGQITVRIADNGPGIDLSSIPEALCSGFSTGATLGMGFTLMLELADRIHLATDDRGTALQLTFRAH
jgi:anti-sigma regulatory factor (Ser/Thr protein kinase)